MPPAVADASPSFAQRVAEWQPFYGTLAGATATLAGLLFVALSLNIDILLRGDQAHFRALASHTMRAYLSVFILAMLMLIPHELPTTVGIALVITGLIGAADFFFSLRLAFPRGGSVRLTRIRIVGSLICFAGLVDLGGSLLVWPEISLVWLSPLVLTLLVMATRNSWQLLITLREPGKPGPG